MKKSSSAVFSLVVAVLAGFCLSACGGGSGETGSGQVPIGVVIPLSGGLADPVRGIHDAIELAVEEINDAAAASGAKTVRLIAEDSRGTKNGAWAAVNRLAANDEIVAAIGPITSSGSDWVIPFSEENRFLLISPTAAAGGLGAKGKFFFRTVHGVDVQIPETFRKNEPAYANVAAVVNEADTFSISAHNAVVKALESRNITVTEYVFRQVMPAAAEPTVESILASVKAADHDAVYVSTLPPNRIKILVGAKRLGMDIPVIMRGLTVDSVTVANGMEPGSAEGAVALTNWNPSGDTPGNEEFRRNFRAKYGSEPGADSAAAYALVNILVAAVYSAGAEAGDSEILREKLLETKDFDTVLGSFSFDENGDPEYDAFFTLRVNASGGFEPAR